jgi:uncharacterized protein DUF3179
VFFPLILILLSIASAFVVAYGTDPRWMQYGHGLDLILFARRFQWPLVTLSLLGCIGVLGLIVSGKRRAWWLIGLAPVLALFAHRFALGPSAGGMAAVENPTFVTANEAGFIGDDDYIVGVSFDGGFYAYPYSQLYSTPVVLQADHEKRMMLIWSAFANRALAVGITRDLHAHDLEVVSTPANALLLYNTRLGQFINGLKGQTIKGEKPGGFGAPIATSKMPWGQWHRLHSDTKLMGPTSGGSRIAGIAPTRPIKPTCPMPPMTLEHPASLQIALIGTTQPSAIESDGVGPAPTNLKADGAAVFVYREAPEQPIRAFGRRVSADLIPRFVRNANSKKHPNATFVDVDTNSGWDANGLWVDGLKDLKGKKLDRVPVDDGLYWGVMKFWYPELELESPATQPVETFREPDEEPTHAATHRARRPRSNRPRSSQAPSRGTR